MFEDILQASIYVSEILVFFNRFAWILTSNYPAIDS